MIRKLLLLFLVATATACSSTSPAQLTAPESGDPALVTAPPAPPAPTVSAELQLAVPAHLTVLQGRSKLTQLHVAGADGELLYINVNTTGPAGLFHYRVVDHAARTILWRVSHLTIPGAYKIRVAAEAPDGRRSNTVEFYVTVAAS